MPESAPNEAALRAAREILQRIKKAGGGDLNACVVAEGGGECGVGCGTHMAEAIAAIIVRHLPAFAAEKPSEA